MVAPAPIDRATRELIAELGKGEQVDPSVRGMLVDLLAESEKPRSAGDAVHSVAEWMSATPEEAGSGPRRSAAPRRCAATQRQGWQAARVPARLHLSAPRRPRSSAKGRRSLPHAIGGRLALAYYAEPRATIDIDLNVFVLSRALGGRRQRPGPARHRHGEPRFRRPPARRAVPALVGSEPDRPFLLARPHPRGDVQAGQAPALRRRDPPLRGTEHLAVFKAMFGRPKDWIDIEQMLLATEDLDVADIERWLEGMVGKDDPRSSALRS